MLREGNPLGSSASLVMVYLPSNATPATACTPPDTAASRRAIQLLDDLEAAIAANDPDAYNRHIEQAADQVPPAIVLAILQRYLPALLSEEHNDRQLAWGMGVRL